MEEHKFKVGDMVKVIRFTYDREKKHLGKIGKVQEVSSEDNACRVFFSDLYSLWFYFKELELITKNKIKTKPEDLTKYLLYGTGCDNSEYADNEEALKEIAKQRINNSDWSGRMILYKCVPLYEIESKPILKPLNGKKRGPKPKPKKKTTKANGKAKYNHKRWNLEEDKYIREAMAMKVHPKRMAEELGRSITAVNARMHNLKVR